MRVETVLIDANLARKMLDGNIGNRNIRKGWVKHLAHIMSEGDFKLTHQGICVSGDGRVLDGQHRLHAVVESGVACLMQVSYVENDGIFDSIDTGIKRTLSDSTGIGTRVASVYSLAYQLFSSGKITARRARDLDSSYFGQIVRDLIEYSGKNRRFYSSSSARLAAALSVLNGRDKDYVFSMYRNLIALDFAEMQSVSYALIRAVDNGAVDQHSKYNSLCFMFKAFNSDTNVKSIRLTVNQMRCTLNLSSKLLQHYIDECRIISI